MEGAVASGGVGSGVAGLRGGGPDDVLDGAEPRQRDERDDEQPDGREEDAVDPVATPALPTDEAAGDLTQREEHGVETHDGAAVAWIRLAHVGEEPERRRRRAGEDEQARADRQPADRARPVRLAGAVVDERRGDDADDPANDAVEDDRRPPQLLEPIPPEREAGEKHDEAGGQPECDLRADEPAHEELVGEPGGRLLDQLEDRLARPQPERAVDRDPRRGEEPYMRARQKRQVAPPARVRFR